MLHLSKLIFLCLFCTLFLYTYDHFSKSPEENAFPSSNTSEAVNFDTQPSTQDVAQSSKELPAPADFVPKTTQGTTNTSNERGPKILQATMMFGEKYVGLNERTLQTHVDHAKRWGYGNYILRQEIVGAGQWDKFIFSKILHVLDLVIGELKRPPKKRAEWVVWYDADTLILNPNIHWELFLPPSDFSNIHFMATKNLDGFNAGLFFFRVHEWSVNILSDAYSLPRLSDIDISGNIEQNALKHLFGQDPNKKHIIYQPQLWYNGFKGDGRAETEISEGDLLVHFAGVNHDGEGDRKKELMSEWFAKLESQPEKWQVPLEKTKYPREIEQFWRTYKEGKEMLDTVRIPPDEQPGLQEDVKRARNELKWAIEELAYDAEHMKKCMEDMTQALKTAGKQQVVAEAVGHVNENEVSAVSGSDPSSDTQEQLAAGNGKTESSHVKARFKSSPGE